MEEPGAKKTLLATGESAGGSASLESDPHARKWPTCWLMGEVVGEKIGGWRVVHHWLMLGFFPGSISGPGTPSGKGRWSEIKQLSENFSDKQKILKAAEGSRVACDVGRVADGKHNP